MNLIYYSTRRLFDKNLDVILLGCTIWEDYATNEFFPFMNNLLYYEMLKVQLFVNGFLPNLRSMYSCFSKTTAEIFPALYQHMFS